MKIIVYIKSLSNMLFMLQTIFSHDSRRQSLVLTSRLWSALLTFNNWGRIARGRKLLRKRIPRGRKMGLNLWRIVLRNALYHNRVFQWRTLVVILPCLNWSSEWLACLLTNLGFSNPKRLIFFVIPYISRGARDSRGLRGSLIILSFLQLLVFFL